jgi:hypothetical protein
MTITRSEADKKETAGCRESSLLFIKKIRSSKRMSRIQNADIHRFDR